MVGTEYGMAWEMTHGLAAGCVSCIADQSVGGRERERISTSFLDGIEGNLFQRWKAVGNDDS